MSLENATLIKYVPSGDYRLVIKLSDDTTLTTRDDFSTLIALKHDYNALPDSERAVFIEHFIKEKMSS